MVFHDAEFVAAGGEEELDAVDQLFVPLPAQVLDVEVALRIGFDVERIRFQVIGREDLIWACYESDGTLETVPGTCKVHRCGRLL
jgi:hypothetical protein